MFDFLLEEKNFRSLRAYINFLSDLPDTLAEIKRFSDAYQRSGYTLMTPPDAQALTRAAIANESRWRAIVMVIPSLKTMSRHLVVQASTFLKEFEQVAQQAVGPANRQSLMSVDPRRFTPINSGSHGTNHPPDIIYLMNNLCWRLDQCAKVAAHFKTLIIEVTQTVHSVFVRFNESLAQRLCVCDSTLSKIEAYYVVGRIGLPNMQYDSAGYYSEEQRREKAREHLRALAGIYVSAISAGNNLADFCHRMSYLLTHVKKEFQSNDLHRSLRRARSSLSQIAYPMEELNEMVNALERMSPGSRS